MQKLAVDVTVLVPAAENAVSGTAMRPSDVITQYGGRTTEIGNTDAEGRLILADALAYAVDRLKPDVLIDAATLTGAMKVALGTETAGYFANDDELAAALAAASEASGERLWRMPLLHDYADLLSSPVADSRNDPGGPGSDHGGAVPAAVRGRRRLGPSRHRRAGPGRGRRCRREQGRDRFRRPAARPLPGSGRRRLSLPGRSARCRTS